MSHFHETFIKDNPNLKFDELAALWTLLQINSSPHSTPPNARLQIFISRNKNLEYFDFNQYDIFTSLNSLLEKKNLKFLAKQLDKKFKNRIFIDETLEIFLTRNSSAINSPVFFKGDQLLKAGESIPIIQFEKLIRNYPLKKVNSLPKGHQFQYSKKISCNFDPGLYENNIFLIKPQNQIQRNIFGLAVNNQIFLAVTSSIPNLPLAFNKMPIIPSLKNPPPAPWCKLKKTSTVFYSTEGRDPAQHLANLLGRFEKKQDLFDKESLSALLAKPRKLTLLNPERLLIEDSHSSTEQSVPLYKVLKLGNISGLHKGEFFIDNRNETEVLCK